MNNLVINLPSSAGVYLFKNSKNEIIYIGKAINLKNRVRSYFQTNYSAKTKLLVENITSIETIRVFSDLEALILEASLIKKYQPYFNSRLKDDKDYLYIIFSKENFPKVTTGRKRDIGKSSAYFGPFPSSNAVRLTLKIIRKIFPFRTSCKPESGKVCFSFHLGLCPGVCGGKISKSDYTHLLGKLKRFLNGETKWVLQSLEKEMKTQAKNLNFEAAQKIRLKIESIKSTTNKIEEVDKYLSGPEVLDSIYERQLSEFQKVLGLIHKPVRIECYDISNISGEFATGSMVVLINGEASKDDYRRFKIKFNKGINDPAMMSEVLNRRFRNDWPKPDLIIVDGGKSQLNAAIKVVSQLGLSIKVIGLAKKLEEVFQANTDKPLRFEKNSAALYLLQRIRDEAHRFAITYHRYLRSTNFLNR